MVFFVFVEHNRGEGFDSRTYYKNTAICKYNNNLLALFKSLQMKKLALLLLLFYVSVASAQRVVIKHQHYTTTFDEQLYYPVLVTWTLTASDICAKGTPKWIDRDSEKFAPDPVLPTYTNLKKYYAGNPGKWQQGHNCDADDNSCNAQEMKESFYYSNMTPQAPDLNEHRWAQLEKYTRTIAETTTVHVWCGAYGVQTTMGIVTVPKYCWKVLKYDDTEEIYVMPNDSSVMDHPFSYYKDITTIKKLRKATGLKLTGL